MRASFVLSVEQRSNNNKINHIIKMYSSIKFYSTSIYSTVCSPLLGEPIRIRFGEVMRKVASMNILCGWDRCANDTLFHRQERSIASQCWRCLAIACRTQCRSMLRIFGCSIKIWARPSEDHACLYDRTYHVRFIKFLPLAALSMTESRGGNPTHVFVFVRYSFKITGDLIKTHAYAIRNL